MGAAPLVVRVGTDGAVGAVTMIFLVITITTGRCGFAGTLGAFVGEASAAGLGDRPRNVQGATKLKVPRIHAHARTLPRLARRFTGSRVSGISRPIPRGRAR